MDNKSKFRKLIFPSFIVFIIVNVTCVLWRQQLAVKNIDAQVIQLGNIILFAISMLASFMHVKAAENPNPHVFARSIMGATVIKLFVIATSVLIYVFLEGEQKSVGAVFICMGLYIIYTVIEVRTAFKLNSKNNGRK